MPEIVDDCTVDPTEVDPGLDTEESAAAREATYRPPRLGVYHFPQDDRFVLAPCLEDAVRFWRVFFGLTTSEPESVDVLCSPEDAIMDGDVDGAEDDS